MTKTNDKNKPYITHIKSTVKKGVDTELAPKTLIVGPNGAGKSTIINSVELAMGGFASDIIGRSTMRKGSDLIVLANDGKSLDVDATLSTGDHALFSTEKTRTGAKRPTHIPPQGGADFPFINTTENLTGSAAKARSFLMRTIGENIDMHHVVQCFSVPMQPTFQAKAEALQKLDKSKSPVDVLIQIGEESSKKSRSLSSEIKVLEKMRDESMSSLAFPPTDSQIQEAKQLEIEALQVYQASGVNRITKENLEEARQRAITATKSLTAAEGRYNLKVQVYNALPHDETDGSYKNWSLTEIRRTLIPPAELQVKLGMDRCLVCETGSTDFAHRCETLKSANAKADALFTAAKELGEAREEMGARRESAERETKYWQSLKSQVCDDGSDEKHQQLHDAYYLVVNSRIELEQAKAAWAEISNLKDRIAEKEEDQKKSKELQKQSTAAIKSLLQASVKAFESTVQSYLPTSEVFGLDIDPKKDTCRFGLRRNKVLISALSGAEWARVITAIGCATVNGSSHALFIPEERAYDSNTLSDVMTALENAPGQVILTSTVPPSRPNKEWLVIDLSDNQ